MRFFSKNTQTLIASCILVITLFIYPNITQSQVLAANANNKFGIHIISPVPQEASDASSLVNSSGGDWGYVTFLIESKDRNENKWQEFFNELRRRHLIPIVRLATKPVNEHWERPYEKEYEAWADFLNKLNWPIKNRYVVIYNEPNHGKEWGNFTDPRHYARVLSSTIDALKQKSADFFVMNAGFDAAAPHQPPQYFDELLYLQEMEKEVPGIFNRLDGWSSHSYPNPAFAGSPLAFGRATVNGWIWELQVLRSLGVTRNLPIFITETGWKRSALISSELVGQYLQTAFAGAWSADQIVAVTPFLLNYEEPPFEDFSFKNQPQYNMMAGLPKQKGAPVQENKAQLQKGEIYSSIVSGQNYNISLTFKNTGQSIWDSQTKLVMLQGGKELGLENVAVENIVEPNQEHTFNLMLKAPVNGIFKVVLNLFNAGKKFDTSDLEFTTEVKEPVILLIKSGLNWKKDFSGNYFLTVKGAVGQSTRIAAFNKSGMSPEIEVRDLLPDYAFDFILERPYYHPVTIRQTLKSGVNVLDFGKLQPDILSAILHPKQFLLYFDLFRPS